MLFNRSIWFLLVAILLINCSKKEEIKPCIAPNNLVFNSLSDESSANYLDSAEVRGHKFYITRFFTPNGDAINDYFYFYIKDTENNPGIKYSYHVFDNCNNVIAKDTLNFWSAGAKSITSGLYNYKIEAKLESGEAISTQGKVDLIRKMY